MALLKADNLLGLMPIGSSLRSRLFKLAFLPLAVSFPLVLLVLGLVGGSFYDARLAAMVRSNLSTVRSHLVHERLHTEFFLSQQLKSGFLTKLLATRAPLATLQEALTIQAATIRLDLLCITDRQGRIIAANSGSLPGASLSESFVLQQAITGVKNSGFELIAQQQLADLAPALAARAGTTSPPASQKIVASMAPPGSGLMLLVAAPFPLSNDYADAVLCAGLLLNNDTLLIDTLRTITFPLTPDSERINGFVRLFLADRGIASSADDVDMPSTAGDREGAIAWQTVAQGREYVHQVQVGGHPYLNAFAPIIGAQGKALGMMEVSIPAADYRNEKWLLIGGVTTLLVLSMFGAALVFQRGTRRVVQRLEMSIATMKAAKTDLQSTRIDLDDTQDEITLLGAHFNELLDALQAGEEAQEQARQELASEAARRRALFNHERDGLVLLNEDGSIFEANPSFLALLGYQTEELAALHIGDWDARYQQLSAANVASLLHEEQRLAETLYRRKDGSTLVVEVTNSCIQWHGHISYLLSIRDATGIRELQRQLSQAQRLESLGQIAAGIAHEINTPMQFLLSNVSFIEESYVDISGLLDRLQATDQSSLLRQSGVDIDFLHEEIPACFREMHDGIDRVIKIIAAMKEFSHPGGSSKTLTDINHLLDNALIVCRNEWKYDAQVITCFDPALPKILCFPDQLNQVLLNLIINACHAIVSRKESEADHVGLISITTKVNGQEVHIQVKDNGCGIPEAVRHRIFDPFFTTKTVGKGTGQGLAIVHDIIVNKHGGRIQFDSALGEGTTFIVSLPAQTE